MALFSSSLIVLFCVTTSLRGSESASEICRGTHCFSGQDWSRRCVGAQCPGRTDATASRRQFHHSAPSRQAQIHPGYQQDGQSSHHRAQSAPYVPYTIIQPQRGFAHMPDGTRRTNPRTITAEVFHPGCAGGTCPTGVSHRTTDDDGSTRECKGIECKLPHRMRHTPKSCVGESCGGDDGRGVSSPVHVTDRAAQFLEDFSDFGAERGASSLGIQLTCDMKPGQ